MSPADLTAMYTEKITEAWREVVATGERHVGALVAVGALLNEAKAARPLDDDGRQVDWIPYFGSMSLPFGLGKAEKLMGIAAEPIIADSSNWKILPPHLSTLDDLRKLDSRAGEGTLARALAAKLIDPDMTTLNIDDIVATLAPPPKLSPAEEAALAPAMRTPAPKKKPKALIEAEARVQALQTEVARQRETRGDLELDSIFVRSQVLCTLCGKEYWLEDARAQSDITAWIKAHIDESHPGDKGYVSVRYVIDRSLPPPKKIITDEEREEWRTMMPAFASTWAPKALPPCECPSCKPTGSTTAAADETPEDEAAPASSEPVEQPATGPDGLSDDDTALAAFYRRAYGD